MKNKAYSKKAHKDFGADEVERMRERKERAIERYLGKKALRDEWEPFKHLDPTYFMYLNHLVYRLETGVKNMGADIE